MKESMQEDFLSIDPTAALVIIALAGLFFLIRRWGESFHPPHINFSNIWGLKVEEPSFREKYSALPYYLILTALVFFAIAFVDPHYYIPKKVEDKEQPPLKQASIPTEGVAMYLVLDRSGSMAQEVRATSSEGRRKTVAKLDLLKQVTRDFIQGNPYSGLKGRPNDMLGLVSFARGAQVLVPLTLDHQALLKQLESLQFATDPEEDGTSIGYAIFKTANLITATRHYAEDLPEGEKPAYEINSTVMILVTDGFQSPSPLDQGKRLRNIELVEAADYARSNGIKIYIINVEPRLSTEEFALHRKLMKQVAELTGGKFFLVDSSMDLDQIYREIDRLEKSKLPVETRYVTPPKSQLPHLYQRVSFYPVLIAVGVVILAISILLETIVMRKVP